MDWLAKGKAVWKFADNFNADLIVGSKYMTERNPELLAKAFLSDYEPDYYTKVAKGDIIVAGDNFGFGHPHDQGIIAMEALGISVLVADSFYPAYYRLGIYRGFPLLACPGISDKVKVGDVLEVNIETGLVKNSTGGVTLQGEPMSPVLREIIAAGGLSLIHI